MTRPKRSSFDLKQTLNRLQAGRRGALSVCMSVRINSPEYEAASQMLMAVDNLVEHLVGDKSHLHASAHRTTTGSKTDECPPS